MSHLLALSSDHTPASGSKILQAGQASPLSLAFLPDCRNRRAFEPASRCLRTITLALEPISTPSCFNEEADDRTFDLDDLTTRSRLRLHRLTPARATKPRGTALLLAAEHRAYHSAAPTASISCHSTESSTTPVGTQDQDSRRSRCATCSKSHKQEVVQVRGSMAATSKVYI